jgi:hypothetical protein
VETVLALRTRRAAFASPKNELQDFPTETAQVRVFPALSRLNGIEKIRTSQDFRQIMFALERLDLINRRKQTENALRFVHETCTISPMIGRRSEIAFRPTGHLKGRMTHEEGSDPGSGDDHASWNDVHRVCL